MIDNNKVSNIPCRLHNVGEGGVAGADEVIDDKSGLTLEELVGNKDYTPAAYSGMGRVVLKKNMVEGVNTLTQDMFYKGEAGSRVPNTNTIYVIQYDFALGEDITVPANCVLEFDGGSVSGAYTITGNNTIINARENIIFDEYINISGSWLCPYITSNWFKNVENNNRVKQLINLSSNDIENIIVIQNGTYTVSVNSNAESVLALKSNTHLYILGTISLNTNNFSNYQIIGVGDVENVYIYGGTLIGDVETHTGTSGEWGYGILFQKAINCYVYNTIIKNCWGDGIEVTGYAEPVQGEFTQASKNIFINNVVCDSNRRQGLSVTHALDVYISNSKFVNTGSIKYTNPCRGLDIEPNYGGDWKQSTKNVTVDNCEFIGNKNGGLVLYSSHHANINSVVKNCSFNGQALDISSPSCKIENCKDFYLGISSDVSSSTDFPVITIDKCCFDSFSLSTTVTEAYVQVNLNNCTLGEKDTPNMIINKNSWQLHEKVYFNNCKCYCNNQLTNNTIYWDLVFTDCEIIQKTDNEYNYVYGGTFVRCKIDVYNFRIIYIVKVYDCIINYRTLNYIFILDDNINTLDIRNNIFLQENGVLIADYGHTGDTLIVEQTLVSSMNNVSTLSGSFTTFKNRTTNFPS